MDFVSRTIRPVPLNSEHCETSPSPFGKATNVHVPALVPALAPARDRCAAKPHLDLAGTLSRRGGSDAVADRQMLQPDDE